MKNNNQGKNVLMGIQFRFIGFVLIASYFFLSSPPFLQKSSGIIPLVSAKVEQSENSENTQKALLQVVDFGGTAPGSPVAGLDQIQTLQAGSSNGKLGESVADLVGTKKMLVLRVYFTGDPVSTRFSAAQLQGILGNLDTLWQNISYGNINLQSQLSPLFQLPGIRSDYIGGEDEGRKWWRLLNEAIAAAPDGLDWTNLDILSVLIAMPAEGQFYRGYGASGCTLPAGPGTNATMQVGCLAVGENPGEAVTYVWGRWAHEMGHSLQQAGPAHPSNYNSEYELMDALYPGQSGVFEKLPEMGFPGWMPPTKYQSFTPICSVGPSPCTGVGGGEISIWAMEYNPAGQPNAQAIRAYITNNLYYMISVRRRVLGDDLYPISPPGIPDEGVLIERVSIGGDSTTNDCPGEPAPCRRTVVVQGNSGDPKKLWKEGNTFANSSDGIFINIKQKIDDDNYLVRVTYDAGNQPDVMINSWTSPPGNTWETTDIWVDSPVNGYGYYRYGMWNDGTGNQVPIGSGDDPAIRQPNRLYVRVRNSGSLPASNVVVRLEITDPPGKGIEGANGWIPLGSLTSSEFPSLANINPGQFTDVYLNWSPDFAISPSDLAAGLFEFHSCIRVKIDNLPGETVFGNQDGDGEQENIDYFEATPPTNLPTIYQDVIWLRNDDPSNPQFFTLNYDSNLPAEWEFDLNGGNLGVTLDPGELRPIPITITPNGQAVVGSSFGVDVFASRIANLENSITPGETHPENKILGGVRVQAFVLVPPILTCEAEKQSDYEIYVKGKLEGTANYTDPENPFKVMIEGVDSKSHQLFLPDTLVVLDVAEDGTFSGFLNPSDLLLNADHVACFFAGTTHLASVSSGYAPIHETPVTTTLYAANGVIFESPDNNVHIEFPEDAVSEDHTLAFTRYLAPGMPLAGWQTGVYHFALTAETLGGIPTTQFIEPYVLTVRYSDQELAHMGVLESNLNLAYWNGQAWVMALPCPGCSHDLENNIITVVLDHFTPFSLIGEGFNIFLPIIER